jgi:hypothetical protein
VRILVLAFGLAALAACSAPCPLVCQGNSDCPIGFYCLNQSACLQDCLRCGGSCVESFANCSSCGASCAQGEKCLRGKCGSACDGTTTDCNGSCYDLTRDPQHCGGCGNHCAVGETCVASACTKVDVCG